MHGILAAADPTTAPGVVSTISDNSTNLLPVLLTVGGAAVLVSAGVLALKKGWGLFSKMIKA